MEVKGGSMIYTMIESFDKNMLIEIVQKHFDDCWKAQGGVCITIVPTFWSRKKLYSQALVKN